MRRRLALEKALCFGVTTERGEPRNGETADTSSEGSDPAARGLGVCGCAKEAAESGRMGLSPVLLLVLALAVSGWPARVAAVSTFTGEGFDFMGQPGRYYSLINTPGVQVRPFAACSWLLQTRSKCMVVAVAGERQSRGRASAVSDDQRAAPCRSPQGIRRAWATTPVRTKDVLQFRCVQCFTRSCCKDELTVHCATDKLSCLRSFPDRGYRSRVWDRGC